MTDSVALQVGDRRIERFLSYEIHADIYVADDAFSLEVARPEVRIKPGQLCRIYVNDALELTGIIDSCTRQYDKRGLTYRIEGRDLVGLLVDSYVEKENWKTVQNMLLSDLAEMLLKNVPFINRKNIEYQENIVGKLKGKKRTVDDPEPGFMDTPQAISQIEPGMTVFEVLKNYSASRGLMFFAKPDGTLVFGRPTVSGEPQFNIASTTSGGNVLSAEESDDMSRRYSQVTVIGQRQGQDIDADPEDINTPSGVVTDDTFPFHKPYVTVDNNDSQSPALHARMIMEQQLHQGYQLGYSVQGHSQRGKNWGINELCRVQDEILGVDGVYLVYGRTLSRSRDGGTITRLKLGAPGRVI